MTMQAAQREAHADARKRADGMVTKDGYLVVKAIRKETREVDFIASTGTEDSHGEIVDPDSWDLRDYLANPVVLYGHQAYELPIGQCTQISVVAGQLICTLKFSDATQRAQEVWALVQEKTLRAVSVGFTPVNGGYEVRDGDEVWVWKNQKLKEISVVAVGANPEALARMKAAIISAKKQDERVGVPALDPQQEAGTPGTKGTIIMSQKTIEQVSKDLEDKSAANGELTKKLADTNVRLVEAEQKADKADAARTLAEKALGDATSKIEKLELAAKTLEAEHAKACADRDTNKKEFDAANAELIKLEVEGYVGKKINPGERDEFIELRKSNKELFKKMIDKRPDLALDGKVTGDDATKSAALGPSTTEAPAMNATALFNEL